MNKTYVKAPTGADLRAFVAYSEREHGEGVTVADVVDAFGISGPSARVHLSGLVARGFLNVDRDAALHVWTVRPC